MVDLKVISLFFRRRLGALLSLCVVGPLGFWLWRYYDGPWKVWVNFYATGIIYEIFWCLVLYLFWPRKEDAVKIAVIVFIFTCVLESLQLWEAAFLENIRSTLIGAALIGTCFVWWQFPYYVAGSVIGFVWLRLLGGRGGT